MRTQKPFFVKKKFLYVLNNVLDKHMLLLSNEASQLISMLTNFTKRTSSLLALDHQFQSGLQISDNNNILTQVFHELK